MLECAMAISRWVLVGTNTKGRVDPGSLEGKGEKKCYDW